MHEHHNTPVMAAAKLALYEDLYRAVEFLIQFQSVDCPSICLQDAMNTLAAARRINAANNMAVWPLPH